MLDRCFDFALSFPSSVVAKVLDEFSPARHALILDPFCGTGTTLLECKRRGLNSIGIDANPVCVLAARMKTSWRIQPEPIRLELQDVLRRARATYRAFLRQYRTARRQGSYLHPTALDIFRQTPQGRYLIASGLLRRGWISPRPALKCLCLAHEIRAIENASARRLLLIALLGLLVPAYSNVKYGPEIYCHRRRLDAPVFRTFRSRVVALLKSIEEHRNRFGHSKATVLTARSLSEGLSRLAPRSVSHVITSPPYPAEHDYTRMTRLELAFGGFINSGHRDLQRIKRRMIPCSSKCSYVDQHYFNSVRRFASIRRLTEQVSHAALGHTSGFARVYPRLVGDYFGAMYQHFAALKSRLRAGARCAYIVGDQSSFFGVHIETATLLANMLESRRLRFRVHDMTIVRNRRGNTGAKRTIPEVILYFAKS